MTEAQLARKVIAHLHEQGYTETWEEVDVGGDRCDIVARRGPILAAVETKMTLGLDVLAQTRRWIGSANLCIAAVPIRYSRRNKAATTIHVGRALQVGIWQIEDSWLDELVPPFLFRRRTNKLERALNENNRSGSGFAPAGSYGGNYATAFRITVKTLLQIVAPNQGITLRKAIESFPHHYSSNSSAVSALSTLIRRGDIDGLRIEYEGRTPCLYLSETREAAQ